MATMSSRISRVAGWLAAKLHVPAGLAVILAVLLLPKVLAVVTLVWFAVGWLAARRLDNDGGH